MTFMRSAPGDNQERDEDVNGRSSGPYGPGPIEWGSTGVQGIPSGDSPSDNDTNARMSLEKLAQLVEASWQEGHT